MDRFLARHAAAWFAIAVLVPGFGVLPAHASGDPVKGADVAKRCLACHTFEKGGANKIGPNLFAIVGREAGTAPGYTYSAAMGSAGFKWTKENLAEYLTNPRKKVPGAKMAFAGISDANQLADLVEYLDTLK